MAEVIATCASLRIFGDSLDPAEISRLLNCLPTASERRGELMGPLGNIVARTGGWKLRIEREDGDNLSEQVVRLLKATNPDPRVWADLAERYIVDVYCGVWLDEPGQGLKLKPAVVAELGQRGISIEFDVYYPDDP